MDVLFSRGKKAIDSLIGKEVPPDEILEKCKTHLGMLVKSIDHVEQKFEKYAAAIIEVSDAGRLVGNDVVNFYKKKESRRASASAFDQVQGELQSLALTVFQEQFHEYEGVASEFSSWKREVNDLRGTVQNLEELRVTAHRRKERIKELQGGNKSMTNMFSSSTGIDKRGELAREEQQYKKEVDEYKRRRDEIKAQTGSFLSARFTKFDTIFVRFMELQHVYFSQSHQLSKQFIPHVKSYRAKHPRRRPSDLGDPADLDDSDSSDSESDDGDAQVARKNPPKPTPQKQKNDDLLDFSSPNPIPNSAPPKQTTLKEKGPVTPKYQEADLLGFDAPNNQEQPVTINQNAEESDDTFGFFSDQGFTSAPSSNNTNASSNNFFDPPPSQKKTSASANSDFDDLFSPQPSDPLSMFNTQGSAKSTSKKPSKDILRKDSNKGFDPMNMNFWDSPKKQTNSAMRGKSDGGRTFDDALPDDPVLAKRVKEAQDKKLAELHALQNKERHESNVRKAAQAHVKNKADAWEYSSPGVRKNIRSLLASIQEMLDYPECKWKPVSLSDILQNKQVVRKYRKAMIVCHPDRTGSLPPEKRAKAERVFLALSEAYETFEKEGGTRR